MPISLKSTVKRKERASSLPRPVREVPETRSDKSVIRSIRQGRRLESPPKDKVTMGYYKQVNGIWHKRCTGPAHEEPTYLPANEKYFYKGSGPNKKLRSKCRLCENWERIGASPGYQHGYIDCIYVRLHFQEAVTRIGMAELARRAGVNRATIYAVIAMKQRRVQKRTVRAVMLELISIRRKKEFSANPVARAHNQRRLIDPEEACAECGTKLDNYTEGCMTCNWRRNGRDKRNQAA